MTGSSRAGFLDNTCSATKVQHDPTGSTIILPASDAATITENESRFNNNVPAIWRLYVSRETRCIMEKRRHEIYKQALRSHTVSYVLVTSDFLKQFIRKSLKVV